MSVPIIPRSSAHRQSHPGQKLPARAGLHRGRRYLSHIDKLAHRLQSCARTTLVTEHDQVSMTILETPIAVIDAQPFQRNLERMAQFAERSGIRLRPHAKSHKCSEIARRQLALGAVGVCCQALGEAVAMVKGGVEDVL